MSHTPGPWYAEEPAGGFSAINQEGGRLIFSVGYPTVEFGDPPMSDETKNANLALIAAAPELMEACVALMAAWNSGAFDSSSKRAEARRGTALDAVSAAIRKAGGTHE